MLTESQASASLVPVTLLSGQLLGEILLSEGDTIRKAKDSAAKFYSNSLVVPTLRLVFQGHELDGEHEVSSLGLLEPGASLVALLEAPRKVLSASADGTAKLFDVESGECEKTFVPDMDRDEGSINSVSVTEDGKMFLLATAGSMFTFSTTSGRCLRRFSWPEMEEGIQHAVLSHDAKLVLLVCLGVVYLIAGNGPPVRLSGQCNALFAAFSPDARKVVVASKECTAQLHDVRSGLCEKVFRGHFGWVHTARFCPKGESILTACADGVTRLFDAISGECIRDFRRHGGCVRSSSFSPDGDKIVAAVDDCTAKSSMVRSFLSRRGLGADSLS